MALQHDDLDINNIKTEDETHSQIKKWYHDLTKYLMILVDLGDTCKNENIYQIWEIGQ